MDNQNRERGCALVVEDDGAIRHLIAAVLRDFGLEVLEAADGAQALGLLAAGVPPLSLIVLDLAMPNVDGEAFLQEFRGLHPDNVPVIVLSALEARKLQEVAGRLSVHAVAKPFELDALTAAVRSALSGSEMELLA